MGCVCVKGAKTERKHNKAKQSNKASERQSPSSSRKDVIGVQADGGRNSSQKNGIEVQADRGGNSSKEGIEVEADNGAIEDSTFPIKADGEESAISTSTRKDEHPVFDNSDPHLVREDSIEPGLRGDHRICTALNVQNGTDGAQVAAGWPPWLSAVAGNAIKGWIPRKLESFEKLDKIGQGTYSSVYRARDLETGKMVALKKVHFQNMNPQSVSFMAREILILRMLDHPNVMKLEGLITSRISSSLYLVFEYMEHDLGGLAALHKLTEPQIKCYMQQLFRGLEHCHRHGVLHRDIKCSNLLIDNNGNLKIGDFGLATKIRLNEKQPLSTCVVTLWYRPPELLLGSTDYGLGVDLWSSGCILAELYAGKPIMPGRTEVEQLHKIFKLCGSPSEEYWKRLKLPHAAFSKPRHSYPRRVAEVFKDLSPSALALLESLLAYEPEDRRSATSALHSEFFLTKPLPCDPSSLPKYPPSKEINAKLQHEATQRRRAIGRRGSGYDSSVLRAVPVPSSNAEFKSSLVKGKIQSMGNLVKYNPEEDGGESCFTIELTEGYSQNDHSTETKYVREQGVKSPTPFNPSEYIELNFEKSTGNRQLDYTRETGVEEPRPHTSNNAKL